MIAPADRELLSLVSTLASGADDEPAYRAFLFSLSPIVGAEGGVFRYSDGGNAIAEIRAWRDEGGPIGDASSALPPGGDPSSLPFAHSLVFSFGGRAPDGFSIVLGRSSRPFDDAERTRGEQIVAALAPLIAIRLRLRAREASIRKLEGSCRESESRLDILFEGSHDMVYSVDANDAFTSINSAGLALLGLDDRSRVIGKAFGDFAKTESDRVQLVTKLRGRGYINDYEIILKTAAGASRFCMESDRVIRDGLGAIVGIQGIVKDISDRIAQEREIWKANVELAEANRQLKEAEVLMVQHEKLASIGQLAAGVAHEINNPLGFLTSNHAVLSQFVKSIRDAWNAAASLDSELLRDVAERFNLAYVFDEMETMMRETDDGLKRIMDIVKNLKSFARSEMETSVAPFNLNQGIENTLVVARNEIKYVADVKLRLGDIPDIEAAGGEINQVLLNILVNAAQAIEGQERKERGNICIETKTAGDLVVCEISDDGPGVPPELRHRIFDPFFSTKGPGKGTGLGLSISYDIIVKKHGGGLSIDSSPAGGALFRIELPIRHPPEGAVR